MKTDVGQRTHCRVTCNTCPKETDFASALRQYMPSTTHIAPCALRADGKTAGCDGGNCAGVWNRWMMDYSGEKLWRVGEKCLPDKLRCWREGSTGVVNPLSAGFCSQKFSHLETFKRPCSCIPPDQLPSKYVCPTAMPESSCAAPLPTAFFSVANRGQGLSTGEAMENMQRHIAEYGPIYAAIDATTAFLSWDFKSKPMYTGGGSVAGGHAINVVGWGNSDGTDYWIIRNSWGGAWADRGYAKFRRGVNLDGIEGKECTASMPGDSFEDWSAPECDLTTWTWEYTRLKTQLRKFGANLHISCHKDANLAVFASDRLASTKEVHTGVPGHTFLGLAAQARQPLGLEVDLLERGFGFASGGMWVQLKAKDSRGNEAHSSHFITLPSVPGVEGSSSSGSATTV